VLKVAFKMRGVPVQPYVRRPILEVEDTEIEVIRQTLVELELI
jgi:4-hydroxy-tetrahydrodipicolinate synthase